MNLAEKLLKRLEKVRVRGGGSADRLLGRVSGEYDLDPPAQQSASSALCGRYACAGPVTGEFSGAWVGIFR